MSSLYRARDRLFHWLFRPKRAGCAQSIYDRLFVERIDDA
jgi:hypothetical protein